ncbi:hypothetical protein ACFFRR_006002 [Megaselia abdita]
MSYIDIYSLEAALKNTSNRELTDGSDLTPIRKLMLLCLRQGAGGIVILGRNFRHLNIDKKENVSFDTFKHAIIGTGYDMDDSEIDDLFENFVDVNEFFDKLRPPMSDTRMSSLNEAFSKLDPEGKGSTDSANFKKIYNVDKHPRYQNGDYTKESMDKRMLKDFDENIITKEDFINYYSAISAQIDKDVYFDLLMRESYPGKRGVIHGYFF